MRNWLVGFWICFCMATISWADKRPLPQDSLSRMVRQPSKDQLESYRQNPEYQYYEELEPPAEGFLSRLWRYLIHWLDTFFGDPDYGVTRKGLGYVFVAGMAIFVVLKLMGVNFDGIFTQKSTSFVPYDILSENIHGIPFNEAIEQAIRAGNFRLAVRLHYLRLLKELSDANLINWQLNKTNRTYTYELPAEFQPSFEAITAQFEYVWYGDFAINQAFFNRVRHQFESFQSEILPYANKATSSSK